MQLISAGVLSSALCVLFILRSPEAASAMQQALTLCGQTVIPNLFPFFVLSSFAVQTGVTHAIGICLSPLAKRLFRVEGSGVSVFVIGLICGYPTGAKTAAELVEKGQLSQEDAAHLLPFCNNAGPLFVIGAVGSMLSDRVLGYKLYILHLLSALLTGIILSRKKKPSETLSALPIHAISIGTAIQKAVQNAISSMLSVCGYILFFSVLRSFLPVKSSSPAALLLSGFSEVTAGAAAISASACDIGQKCILLSAVMGFGGLCVFLQVWGMVAPVGISVRAYLKGKLLQSCIAAGLCYLLIWEKPYPFSRWWMVLVFSLFLLWGKLTNAREKSIIRKESRKRSTQL